MKNNILSSFLLLVLLGCGRSAPQPEVQTVRLSLILGTTSDWYYGAERFQQLVEQRTGGRYRVKLDPRRNRP